MDAGDSAGDSLHIWGPGTQRKEAHGHGSGDLGSTQRGAQMLIHQLYSGWLLGLDTVLGTGDMLL